MTKKLMSASEIMSAINAAMAESAALDGDCKQVRVKVICLVRADVAKRLGRNWTVTRVNTGHLGECEGVLDDVVRRIGREYDLMQE